MYFFLLKYPGRTLVFVNSIDAVRRIVPVLTSLRLPAISLHSQLIQKQRLHSLERFKSSPKSILVATDIAARGLDISNVQHVVHYHLPRATDTYIHRSGRTAVESNKVFLYFYVPRKNKNRFDKCLLKLTNEISE